MSIQYLIDENVDPVYAKQMRQRDRNIVVRVVGEENVPDRGTLDPEILIWCELYHFILVTNNRKTMPVHLKEHLEQNRHVPGIFILNPDMGIGETITELLLIARYAFEDEYRDRITFLPIP